MHLFIKTRVHVFVSSDVIPVVTIIKIYIVFVQLFVHNFNFPQKKKRRPIKISTPKEFSYVRTQITVFK